MSLFGYPKDILAFDQGVFGVYTSPGHFSSVITLFALSLLGLNMRRINRNVLIVSSVVLVFLIGVKAPFIVLIFLLLFNLARHASWSGKLLGLTFCIGLLNSWSTLSGIGGSYDIYSGFNSPVSRQLQVLSLVERGNLAEVSTLKVSAEILPRLDGYWIFGVRPDMIENVTSESPSDAYLLYHVAMYGILGLVFLLLPYFLLSFYSRGSGYILIGGLLLSVMDAGLFHGMLSMLIILLIYGVKYERNADINYYNPVEG
jgi:hypothetical protein